MLNPKFSTLATLSSETPTQGSSLAASCEHFFCTKKKKRIPSLCEILGLPETTAKTAHDRPLSQGLRLLWFSKTLRFAWTGRPL